MRIHNPKGSKWVDNTATPNPTEVNRHEHHPERRLDRQDRPYRGRRHPDPAGAAGNHRLVGLDRRGAARQRSDELVPGLYPVRYQHLPDQQVARREPGADVREHRVRQRPGRPIDDEQPRPVPFGGRLLRDQLVGQLEVEVGNAHRVSPQRGKGSDRTAASRGALSDRTRAARISFRPCAVPSGPVSPRPSACRRRRRPSARPPRRSARPCAAVP